MLEQHLTDVLGTFTILNVCELTLFKILKLISHFKILCSLITVIHDTYSIWKSGLQNHTVAPWYRCVNAYPPHSTPSSQSGSAAAKWTAASKTRLQYMCYSTVAWCLLPFPFISHTLMNQNNCPLMASCQRTLTTTQINNKNKS